MQVHIGYVVAALLLCFPECHGTRLRGQPSFFNDLLNLQEVVATEEGAANMTQFPWAQQIPSPQQVAQQQQQQQIPAVAQQVPQMAASQSSQQLNATQQASAGMGAPKVYFLFLAVDKVSNLDVWKQFFTGVPADQYRALVHCKLPSCLAQVQGSPLTPVPTVASYYCTDLVSPMNQLIAIALGMDGQGHPSDKFAFVSDSSLPAKPFSHIYSTLLWRQGSDFCLFPSNEWADIPGPHGLEIAPKHFQWITLSRSHAEKASFLWAGAQMHDFMTRFQMNWASYQWNNNSFADQRNFGCLDEFWYMVALFGSLSSESAQTHKEVTLPKFTGSPVRVAAGEGWQGSCDTFVIWAKYLNSAGYNPFSKFHQSLDAPSVPHPGNAQRPGWWDTMSPTGIAAIRNSDFLFMRKFIDNPTLAGGGHFGTTYAQIVFAG